MSYLNKQELTDIWYIAKILSEVDYSKASDEKKVDIFLEKLSQRPIGKAYTYEKAKTPIMDVIEKELGHLPAKNIGRKVTNWTTRTARESA